MKGQGLFILLGIVLVLLVVTNPGPERFERFVAEEVATQVTANVPQAGPLSALGGQFAARLVRQHTERANYLFFSTYTLRLPGLEGPEQEWRFLGVGTLFLETNRPEALR